MPKAMLAIRRYPMAILLATLVFLATLAITTGSLGIVGAGGNGGDDDGGSGFGGTGRSGEFGGSGFGGTGTPSPFLTIEENQLEPAPEQSLDPTPPAPVESPAFEQLVEQATEPLIPETPNTIEIPEVVEVPAPPAELAIEVAETDEVFETVEVAETPEALEALEAPVEIAISDSPLEASQLAESTPLMEKVTLTNEAENVTELQASNEDAPQLAAGTVEPGEAEDPDRNILPERIQRPELPPFQRVRPPERPSIATPSRAH